MRKIVLTTALFVAGGAAGYFADEITGSGIAAFAISQVSPSCKIKGNISINSGARIYHVPGQKYYSQTRIRPEHGERWFCTEAEAQKAGWRKARS